MVARIWLALIAICLVPCCFGQATYVQFDSTMPKDVVNRLFSLILEGSPYPVVNLENNVTILPNSFILSFGNTTQTNQLISQSELQSVGPEGYITRSSSPGNNTLIIATNGNPAENLAPFIVYNNIGLYYGSYEILKQLGYAFYHPLQTLVPSSFRPPANLIDIIEQPRYSIRGWHYHTEHPLELTEYLNGMDSGDTPWESMSSELFQFAEWLVANRQNRLEWVLLWTQDWDEFAWSKQRQDRLTQIVDTLHTWGIAAGADVPIAEQQQHAWYMTGPRYTTEQQFQNITDHIDWIMKVNYDFIATESGYSEFTHPNCTLMLQWMNFTTNYLLSNYPGKRIYIKCHCSSGQVCEDYPNPFTGEPLNFNFLPAYATNDLGIYPHTVQIYNFTEPAPTYGNQNFTYMLEFLVQQSGKREVVFHGETAYWVNYDIDVPLFLPPIYGANRLSDMRTVAETTTLASREAQGQMNFGSGWEWAYWLGDMITCSAVWDPMVEVDYSSALDKTLETILAPMGANIENIKQILLTIIDVERELLVYGNWNGTNPSNVVRRNGQAYLAGWDTWSEWSAIVDPTDATQPAKLTFHNIRDPFQLFGDKDLPDYESEIQPLLNAMQGNFSSLATQFAAERNNVYPEALPFFDEITESIEITALRAQEVYALYEYVWGARHHSPSWRKGQIQSANAAISKAQATIANREANYRVPVDRIAGWRTNPTCYNYGYLWTVHSAYYFWRDYSQATNSSISTKSPCFMNIITPIDVAFGPGKLLNVSLELGEWLDEHNLPSLGNCTTAPSSEPVYPYTPIIDSSTNEHSDQASTDSLFNAWFADHLPYWRNYFS